MTVQSVGNCSADRVVNDSSDRVDNCIATESPTVAPTEPNVSYDGVDNCCADRVAMSRLAREMALDIAEGLYTRNVVSHIPGVVNDCADALSRRHQPGKSFQLPSLLAGGTEVSVGQRNGSWWRSLPLAQSGA